MSTVQKIGSVAQRLDDLSKLIADPSDAGAVGQAVSAAGRRFCDAFSNAQVLRGDEPGAQLPVVGLGRAAASLVCKPYLDGAGFSQPQIGEPPFPGGQCSGEIYRPSGTYVVSCASSGVPAGTVLNWVAGADCIGPITGIGLAAAGSPWIIQQAGASEVFLVGVEYSGNIQFLPRSGVSCAQATASTQRRSASAAPSLLAVNPIGHSDDCGSLPGEFEPGPTPAPSPGPFPPGQEPGIDPTGQPFFFVPPIETPFGDIPLDEDYFGDPIAPAPGAGDGLPGDGLAIGDEAGSVAGGEDGEDIDFGPPPEGRVWVGAIAELSADSRLGNIPGTGPGNTVWPLTLGNFALNYGAFSGSNVRLQSRYTEAFRPVTSLIVTGCFLQTQLGATAKVFPISAPICPENPCEA